MVFWGLLYSEYGPSFGLPQRNCCNIPVTLIEIPRQFSKRVIAYLRQLGFRQLGSPRAQDFGRNAYFKPKA
jgi:hypothetical protein